MQKEFIPESMGQYVVLALLMQKNNGSWRMYIDNRQINHINVKYWFAILTFQDLLDYLESAQIFLKIDLCSGIIKLELGL